MKRQGRFASISNISANESSILLRGVTTEDIRGILTNLKRKYDAETWANLIDDLFIHIVDRNNPHKLEISQLDKQIIDVLYETWLRLEYRGTKNEFIEILFCEIPVVDIDQEGVLLEGTDEKSVPTVAALAFLIHLHNTSLDAHEDLIKQYLGTFNTYKKFKSQFKWIVSRRNNLGLEDFDSYSKDDGLYWYPMDEYLEDNMLFMLQISPGDYPDLEGPPQLTRYSFGLDYPLYFSWNIIYSGWQESIWHKNPEELEEKSVPYIYVYTTESEVVVQWGSRYSLNGDIISSNVDSYQHDSGKNSLTMTIEVVDNMGYRLEFEDKNFFKNIDEDYWKFIPDVRLCARNVIYGGFRTASDVATNFLGMLRGNYTIEQRKLLRDNLVLDHSFEI